MPPMKGYSSSEHRFVGSITQDKLGIIYFISRPGIMTFDGVRFDRVLDDVYGLNDINKDAQGNIYALGANMFLKSNVDSIGRIKFVNLFDRIKDVKIPGGGLFPTSQKVYVRTRVGILEYDIQSDSLRFYPGNYSHGFVKDDSFWVIRDQGKELGIFNKGQFTRAPFTDSLTNNNIPIRSLTLNFTGQERILNLPSGLVAYSGNTPRLRPLQDIGAFRENLSTTASFNSRFHFLGNNLKGGIIIDSLGNQRQSFSTSTGWASNNAIGSYVDRESNLWIGLFGYKKNQLVKTEHGSDLALWSMPGTPLDMVSYKGKSYLSTTQNLFVIDPITREMKPVFDKDHRVESVVNFKIGNEQHLLAAITPEGQILEIDEAGKTKVIFETSAITWVSQSRTNPNRLYIVHDNQITLLIYAKGNWQPHPMKVDFLTHSLIEDQDGSIWLSNNTYNGLIRLIPQTKDDVFSIQEQISYSTKDGLPDAFFFPCLVGDHQVLFKSNLGLLQFNPSSKRFEKWQGLGKKVHALGQYRTVFKNEYDGSYYLQKLQLEGAQIIQVKPNANGDTSIITMPMRRIFQAVGIIGDRTFLADEESVWFAGVEDYLVRYKASEDIKSYQSPFHCIIRKVTLNDSVLYGGYDPGQKVNPLKPSLLYDSGRFIIRFAAPFYDYEDQTLFSYMMEGLDKAWSPWHRVTEKEYQNFSEGEYTFLVKAKNVYGQESEVASFSFQVLPPWYRTWWAYTIYVLLFGFYVMGLVWILTRSLQRKKIELEEMVEEKTHELTQTNLQLLSANQELETNREELKQSNDELLAINDYLKKTQRQLVESEKMASLGQLTAGIAHEINNPINFISGGVQAINAVTQELMESNARTPEKLESTIRDIQDLMASINNGVNRTTNIISSLKTFTSPSVEIDTYINVTDCIDSAIILLKRKMADHEIGLSTSYHHHSQVLANSSQLSQVIINIVDNAIHALKAVNGVRTISIQTLEQNNELHIRLKDNGTGISEKDQAHIFEPFFTTKEVGAGVGLGLSISYSIIEKHKGNISCVSKMGEGTEFTISLPIG
ncbi:MAG: ATP-binding protein [Cyclobacteriaceae bacterium]|jgi:signal transduction histidine kinase